MSAEIDDKIDMLGIEDFVLEPAELESDEADGNGLPSDETNLIECPHCGNKFRSEQVA